MGQLGGDGAYRIARAGEDAADARHVLEKAVPPVGSGGLAEYGWVGACLPMPASGGLYVVEFVSETEVRVLAYVDPFGRAFSTDEPIVAPPAREPDMAFSRRREQPAPGVEEGVVSVRSQARGNVQVALFRVEGDRYALLESWYCFGPYGEGLAYEDAMARAYLAFVHRPALGAMAAPRRGLRFVQDRLRSLPPLQALRCIADDVHYADRDTAYRPPALASLLAGWLVEAGLDDLAERGVADDALRLEPSTRYARTAYLMPAGEDAQVPRRTVWALEAALNRFQLLEEELGEQAARASTEECARRDALLIESAAVQHPAPGVLCDVPAGDPEGEWAVRCALAGAIERLRLPFRIEALMHVDAASGAIGLDATVPDASLMPSWAWREPAGPDTGGWERALPEARERQARRYALHLGLALAAAAFEAAASIERVDVVLRPLPGDAPEPSSGGTEFPQAEQPPAYVHASFERALYRDFGRFEEARAGDPLPPYEAAGARFDVADADAFSHLAGLPSAAAQRELPETRDVPLPAPAREALASDGCEGVRISYNGGLRRRGEDLADRIVRAGSASDATRIVRAEQDEAARAEDARAVSACTRLMAALAEDGFDRGDQNAVVGRFLGEDRCLAALVRAKTLMPRDPGAAVSALEEAVAEAEALDGFVDGAATVYRTFDSYASRVLYNRARRDGAGEPRSAYADAGKRVALASGSFYRCHLEIVRLLEHSFERADEALRYGRRAIRIAPTTAVGYRQLGRAYMLVGDMENASSTLMEGLGVAVQPDDIAIAYYQLAYVLWKAGRPQEGAACYLKSLTVSPVVGPQVAVELQELMEESGVPLVPRDEVDDELERLGVLVAPDEKTLRILDEGAAAAADAGLLAVARNLLAMRLHHRPDDALAAVLRSLAAPSF